MSQRVNDTCYLVGIIMAPPYFVVGYAGTATHDLSGGY